MSREIRVWLGRLLSMAAILAAGLLGGSMFRPSDRAIETDVPAEHEQRQDGAPENHLAKETSPYLKLHKNNPVDWYPWCTEALEKAKRENKLIFLSIGYSSCYWCHVMERESFNDPEIARVLNDSFVSIKVDREELPEVDEIFMTFVQMTVGHGGWPLTVFLTPDAKPIVGGTYLPPRSRGEMSGLLETLGLVVKEWSDNRAALQEQADHLTRSLQTASAPRTFSFRPLDRKTVSDAVQEISAEYDPQFGGFGFDPANPQRPKFPQPCILELLEYQSKRASDEQSMAMLAITLHRMNRGGIWDCLGGGFHRYSVDRYWRVPHFEKMLYDNAQLARVYLDAFELTQERAFRGVAIGIFKFISAEMTSPDGGFYTALDAESEHEEGKYYLWTKQQVQEILPPQEFELFAGLEMKGPPNFEGDRYVLQLVDSLDSISQATKIHVGNLAGSLERSAATLLEARKRRPAPLLDTKILTDWNGLMIGAFADGYRIVGNESYRKAAERAAELILTKSQADDGRLLHVYAAGAARIDGYLDDYAFFLDGLLALHRATHDERWLTSARAIADQMIGRFWDEANGGFFLTASDREIVLARLKPSEDSVVPSGNSAAALALVRLAESTGEQEYADRAARTIAAFAGSIGRTPSRWPHMVRALGEYLDAGFPPERLGTRGVQEPQIVLARAIMPTTKFTAGNSFQFDVVIEIERPWHIYANPSGSPQFPPTTLAVTSDLPLKDVEIEYPKSSVYRPDGSEQSVPVYSENARFRVRGTLDADAPVGPSELRMSLRYQACNNERCLAARTIRMVVPVEVVAAAKEPDPALESAKRSAQKHVVPSTNGARVQ